MAKKRNYGEGSITYREGRPKPFLAQVFVDGRRLSQSFKTRDEAARWKREVLSKADAGVQVWSGRADLAKSIVAWSKQPHGWRDKTVQQNQHVIEKHIVPHIPRLLKVADVKADHIRKILASLAETGIGTRTQGYARGMLFAFFESLRKEQVVLFNPVEPVQVKHTPKEFSALSLEQVKILFQHTKDTQHEHLWYLAIHTGMRLGELIGLRWSDVQFDHACILVQNQAQWTYTDENRGKSHFSFQPVKTKAGRRRVALGPGAIERLKLQRNRVGMQRLLAAEWDEHDLVFPNGLGRPLEPTNVSRALKKVLAEAGLPNVRFHDLRHTCATLMLLNGVHPKIVSERLGHSSIVITLETYSHVIPGLQERAAANLDSVLTGQRPPDADQLPSVIAMFEKELEK